MANTFRFYTTESISPGSKRHWTPERFLLCEGVPIARVGTLLYARGEVPVEANKDGLIRIIRDPEEVFHQSAISSFAGKPITDEHPPEKVTPLNWKEHTIGVVLNPHRGDGRAEDAELLYADLLIQDQNAIKEVLSGKREVSAGYDAEYEQVQPGIGKQHNIIGNHVALVERGRCGPVCSIGDSAMAVTNNKPRLTTADRRMWASTKDRIMNAFLTGDEEALVDEIDKIPAMLGKTTTGNGIALSEDDMGGLHVHLHNGNTADEPGAPVPGAGGEPPAAGAGGMPASGRGGEGGGGLTLESLAARIDQIEQAIAILVEGESGEGEEGGEEPGAGEAAGGEESGGQRPTGDRRRAAVGDSSSMALAWQEMLSRAEILAPGTRHPTFDARTGAKTTAQNMCSFRRRIVTEAMQRGDDAADAIKAMVGDHRDMSKHLSSMTCDAMQVAFNGASTLLQGIRAGGGQMPAAYPSRGNQVSAVTNVVAEINRKNREAHNRR